MKKIVKVIGATSVVGIILIGTAFAGGYLKVNDSYVTDNRQVRAGTCSNDGNSVFCQENESGSVGWCCKNQTTGDWECKTSFEAASQAACDH